MSGKTLFMIDFLMFFGALFKLVLLSLVFMGCYSLLKAIKFYGEHKVALLKEKMLMIENNHRQKNTTTRTTTYSECKKILGMTFGEQTTYEQDFYMNTPVGERRTIRKNSLFAPELNLPVIAPQVALAYVNAKLGGIPSVASQALKSLNIRK